MITMDSIIPESSSSKEIVECVKARLQQEGREARNLIAYSLPLQDHKTFNSSVKIVADKSKQGINTKEKKLLSHNFKQVKRQRSASAGRDPQASLRARHWGFLFRNLGQAVDEIYQTCEDDESIIECKEAIMMLERYSNDFHKLIEWLKLKWEYENTLPPQRPNSLTWEIRTSSPGKILKSCHKSASMNDAKRMLNFNESKMEKNSLEEEEKRRRKLDSRSPKTEERLCLVLSEKIDEEPGTNSDSEWMANPQTANLKTKDLNATKFSAKEAATNKKPSFLENSNESKIKECKLKPPKDGHVKPSIGTKPATKDIDIKDKVASSTEAIKEVPKPATELSSSKSSENVFKSGQTSKEVKKSNEAQQLKNSHIKPGPLVNMNKASQVRKAFNQSRTPLKAPCSNVWKPTNGSSQNDMKTNNNKHQSQGLFRSSTTLEGTQLNRKHWKKVPERSFCLENAKYPSSSSIASSSNTCSSVQSWADRVRGGTTSERQDSVSSFSVQDDEEGWEVVKRGRRSCGGSSASLNSQTPPNSAKSCVDKTCFDKAKERKEGSYKARSRFQKPTSAVSMPSLYSCKETSQDQNEPCSKSTRKQTCQMQKRKLFENRKSKERLVEEGPSDSAVAVTKTKPNKSSSPHSDKCRKDATNLSKKNESRGISVKKPDLVPKPSSESSKEQVVNPTSKSSQCSDLKSSESKKTEKNGKSIDIEEISNDGMCEKETQILDDEIEEEEEEKLRSNAAAFASAEDEEKRLKLEIEETERETHEMDEIEKIEAGRPPGRVLHIHEKLSSPSRKLPISEKFRKHKERQAKAQELRDKLLQAKSEKLKDLFKRIDEVNMDKERLLGEKRDLFDCKMDRAEEKRRCHLQEIVNKAHDEENKAKEIAFINGLEAQNKLHDIMQLHQNHELRLADRAEERCRKQEEKAAKEAAAQERRKALEAERVARMAELCEKRRRRCERIDRQQAERREELLEQAREKARDREERITALQMAQQVKESELVKKIQQKQEETARRHEENIEQIRQKALESSISKFSRGCDDAPKLLRYETKKLCTLCNSLIASEVYLSSHLGGKQHREALKEHLKRDVTLEESESYNIKFIIDAPDNIEDPQETRDKERKKALKKRCRKIRSRMVLHSEEFLKSFSPPACRETPSKQKTKRALAQISKLMAGQGSGPWPIPDVTLLDRHLLELLRILDSNAQERVAFASLGGFKPLALLLKLIPEVGAGPCVVPCKSLTFCARVLLSACKDSIDNCRFALFSNLTTDLVDCVMRKFEEMTHDSITTPQTPADATAAALMELLAEIMKVMSEAAKTKNEPRDQRMQDLVSYCVSMGVTDKISWFFNHIQNPIDNDPPSAQVILAAMSLLSSLTGTVTAKSKHSDPTQLIGTFRVLEACGVVSLMYGSLLHQGGRSASPPPEELLSPSTLAISLAATTFLRNLAEMDLSMFQFVLGGEGISLEFRHICSFLLWFCSMWPCEELLHNVISLVGSFTVNHKENQMTVQSGETPSVLQQLCSLPWQYFSEPKLTHVLFPTLLSCCLNNQDNLDILQHEMSFQVLEDFLHTEEAPNHPLMKIFRKNLQKKK